MLLLDHYARAQGVSPGDPLDLLVEGTVQRVRVAGLALSPEFILPMAEGDTSPDEARFCVLWVPRSRMAGWTRMQGTFNSVLVRLGPHADLQRPQIASLKALGYASSRIALHYSGLLVLLILLGGLLGTALGVWLGRVMLALYGSQLRLPTLVFELPAWIPLSGIGLSALAGAMGAWGAIRQAIDLPPAEAMRPEAPATYAGGGMQRSLGQRLGPS